MKKITTPHIHLRGPDCTAAGELVVRDLGPDTAAGLTRGWEPKPYAYVDPNEDVVAAVHGRRATLLVVADGHNGKESSLVAVDTVLELLGDDPPPGDLAERQLLEVFTAANQAIMQRTASLRPPHSDSATTMVLTLVAPGRVQWAAMGDSIAVIAAPGQTQMLFSPTRRFLGHPTGMSGSVARGSMAMPEGAWVVVATDGYSDWAPAGDDLARATGLWSAGVDDAAMVVERLMDKARTGGAGDNVAIGVARRPEAHRSSRSGTGSNLGGVSAVASHGDL